MGRDADGPPSATRVTMLSVDVEERGPSPTSRRRRAACPPTPAAAPARSAPPAEAGCRPSRSFVARRLQSSGRTAVPATTAGTGHRQGPLDGHERRADERPHSMSSKGSRRSACDARGTEFLAITMVTTWTPRRALFGELVLHNQASDRDRCWGGQGAGPTLCRSATGDEGPMWTVRPHRPAAYGMHEAPRYQRRLGGRSLDTGAISGSTYLP